MEYLSQISFLGIYIQTTKRKHLPLTFASYIFNPPSICLAGVLRCLYILPRNRLLADTQNVETSFLCVTLIKNVCVLVMCRIKMRKFRAINQCISHAFFKYFCEVYIFSLVFVVIMCKQRHS